MVAPMKEKVFLITAHNWARPFIRWSNVHQFPFEANWKVRFMGKP